VNADGAQHANGAQHGNGGQNANGAQHAKGAANGAKVTAFPRAAGPRRPAPLDRKPEEDRKIVGFGDDLPAFLARPPRVVAGP
jgi:hypothetical protein